MNSFENYYCYGKKVIMAKGSALPQIKEQHIYLLHSGICALCSIDNQKKLKTHLYFTDDHAVGFTHITRQLLDFKSNGSLAIVAKTDCIIYQLDTEVFTQLMSRDVVFANLMFEVLSANYLNIFKRYLQIEEESVPVRICMFLLDYAYNDQGILKLPRFFTYAEIAEYLNIHPVTMSRVMISLKQKGYIIREDHHIILLKPEYLQSLIQKQEEFTY